MTRSLANPATRPGGFAGPAHPALWALAAAGVAATAAWRSNNRLGAVPVAPAGLHLYCAPARPPRVGECVSVLLGLRHNERAAIATVGAALSQTGIGRLDVVLLDDGCPTATRAAVAHEFGDDARLRTLIAAPVPPGWCAPAHRAHQLAVAAKGSVLLFADPAIPLAPAAAAAAATLLRTENLDLAVLDSGRRVERGRAPQSPGAGRFVTAVDTGVYWKLGGYRMAAADPNPLSLLRVVRRTTGRAALADGRRVLLPTRLPADRVPPTPEAAVRVERPGASAYDLNETTQAAAPVWETGGSSSRPSLTDTARRVISVLSGSR